MSRDKLILSMSVGRKKRRIWPWVLAGLIVMLLCIGLYAAFHTSSDEISLHPEPINITDLGMQEWEHLSELTRQSLDNDIITDIPNPIKKNEDPFHIKGRISRNQTLFVAIKNHDLDISDIHQLIASLDGVVDFKKTKPGDRYEIFLDVDKRILKFIYEISPEDISISERHGNEYVAHKVDVHKRTERKMLSGELTSSLYQAFVDLGESGELASHFMQLFKYDINFGTESQRGDTFSVLVDRITLNGAFYRYGRVWAATYTSGARGKTLEAYYFDSGDEFSGYYNRDGQALKRTFLKNPVVGCSVSSPFNPKRMHPILKRIRPHNGIDWACPTGTPVMAFAEGIVTFADWKGGNGNLLVIEHAHGYTSLYAHLYAFGTGIKKGVHVKQGQIVALVGNTGISTGPHLHFGLKLNGKYVDPAKINTSYSVSLTGNKLHAFNQKRDALKVALVQPETVGTTETAQEH